MGNDGGSIARRDDLVKLKPKAEVADRKNQILAAWFFCALSKNELTEPIVSCPLGKLYNKDALLEYLLNPPSSTLPISQTPFGADGVATASHIRSIKDVTTLVLTPNPEVLKGKAVKAGQAGAQSEHLQSKWICPISQREMNGSVRFVYLKHCGNVVSEAALKELRQATKPSISASGNKELAPCSICGQPYKENEPELGVVINSTNKEEIEKLKADWSAQKAREKAEKAEKKSKKRKAADEDQTTLKKKKVMEESAASEQRRTGAPRLPAEVAKALEAQKQKIAKTAVSSLYAKPDDGKKPKDSDWMLRTFTRYA